MGLYHSQNISFLSQSVARLALLDRCLESIMAVDSLGSLGMNHRMMWTNFPRLSYLATRNRLGHTCRRCAYACLQEGAPKLAWCTSRWRALRGILGLGSYRSRLAVVIHGASSLLFPFFDTRSLSIIDRKLTFRI